MMGKGCFCGTTRAGEVHMPYIKQEQLEAGLWEICSYTLGLIQGHLLVQDPQAHRHGLKWQRVNKAEERGACMCLCGKGWGTEKEEENVVCEESSVNELAKDEAGLAASFPPPPPQHFTTMKQCSGLLTHGRTHLPEKKRDGSVVNSVCFCPEPLRMQISLLTCPSELRNRLIYIGELYH